MTIGEAAISVTEHQPVAQPSRVPWSFPLEARSSCWQSEVNDAAPTLASGVNVEFAGLAKSTWYAQTL